MAKQTINLGTGELTGDGESIRSAFDKINNNFDELYTQDSNVVNAHGSGNSAWITVSGSEATIDNLTVRIINDGSNNLEVQFNYDPDATAAISASGDSDNIFSGLTTLAPSNTTWTTLNSITTVGTTRTFTVTDHSFHKVYRGTVVSHAMPDGGLTIGDAYCVIERLK